MVQVKVKSAFYHGNKSYDVDDTPNFTRAEADDMVKSGLVEIVGDAPAETKMEETQNKMEPAPTNKGVKVKA